jgi:hypothetical protein
MLRIESLRSLPRVVGSAARELAARQQTALAKHYAVPVVRALSGTRMRRLSPSKFIRCAGAVTSIGREWQPRCSSRALPQAAEPGPQGSAGTGFARAGCAGALRRQAVPHIGAQASTAEASSTLWPNPSFERTATGGRHWRASRHSSAPVSAAQLQR